MGDTGRARTSPLLAVVAIALVVVGLGALVAAGTWIFRSPVAAIKWAAIATGVGWVAAIISEWLISFKLGA
jgi:hypothetical protein